MSELSSLQKSRLDFMQNNIRRIRSICEWSGNDLANLLGVSRQSVNNLETGKSRMTPSLFFALATILEEFCKKVPDSCELLDACVANFPNNDLSKNCKPSIANICSLWLAEYQDQFTIIKERIFGKNVPSSMQIIEAIAASYKIFICPEVFLLNNGISRVEDICMLAKDAGNTVNVPANAFKEIVSRLDNVTKEQIAQLQNDGVLIFRGDENDSELEKLIIEKFIYYKDKYNLCLITNNEKLAHDVILLNKMTSLETYTLIVINIDEHGYLSLNDNNSIKDIIKKKLQEKQLDFDKDFSRLMIDFENASEEMTNIQGWSVV